MISNDPKFNLGQLNAYKLMFAIKLSMEKRIKKNLAAWFTDLPAINATVFTSDEFGPPINLILVTWSLKVRIKNELLIECFFPDHFNPVLILNWLKKIF